MKDKKYLPKKWLHWLHPQNKEKKCNHLKNVLLSNTLFNAFNNAKNSGVKDVEEFG